MADPTAIQADTSVEASEAGARGDHPSATGGDMPGDEPSDRLLAWLDRHRRWLFALLLVLYVAGYNGRWLINLDSALFVTLGRNLAEGKGYTYHGKPHDWAEPGLPYLIGLNFRWFGVDEFRPLMVVMLLCSLAALALVYRLFKLHADRPTAVLMVGLVGLSENFYRYGYYVFTDMPFLVGALSFLVGYEQVLYSRRAGRRAGLSGWGLIAAGTLGMAAFRPVVAMFLGALAATTAWRLAWGPNRLRHALVAGVVAACVLGFRMVDPRRAEPGQLDHREAKLNDFLAERVGFLAERALTKNGPLLVRETTTEAVFATWIGPGISLVAALVILGLGVSLVRRRTLWGMWIAATLTQMILFLPRERYFLPVFPLLLYGIWLGVVWLQRRVPATLSPAVVGGCLAAILVPNVVMLVRFATMNHLPAARDRNTSLIALAQAIQQSTDEQDLVIAEHARILHYFSRRHVVAPAIARPTPPSRREARAQRDAVAAADDLYAVFPGRDVPGELAALSLEVAPGPPVASVPTYDRRGREERSPLTLHRLRRQVPGAATEGVVPSQ